MPDEAPVTTAVPREAFMGYLQGEAAGAAAWEIACAGSTMAQMTYIVIF
jgi:hypothetical protein